MAIRNIIEINEDKCVGCGKCVNACHNSALQLINGKAKLVSETYCDGLGACIGDCPTGALKVVAKEVDQKEQNTAPKQAEQGFACPGSQARTFNKPAQMQTQVTTEPATGYAKPAVTVNSQLTHWPIQLKLINPAAPAYANADILFAADCSAFALGGFHPELLQGRSLIIACPKLDDPAGYIEKLTELFQSAKPKTVTVARMEVPCCSGLTQYIKTAAQNAKTQTPIKEVTISLDGQIIKTQNLGI